MVLDIRHLPDDGSEDELPQDIAELTAAVAESAAASPGPTDLEPLLTAAIGGDFAAQAVAQLRVLVPTDEGVERLCQIVDDVDDPRRIVAIQMLGHHRQWLFSRSAVNRVLNWARTEADPAAAAALLWVLRQREVVQEFLLHPMAEMAREAALGLPVSPATIDALLDTLLIGRSAEVDRVLTTKLAAVHPSLTARAVDHLLSVADRVTNDALTHVLAHLPQAPMFELFVEGRSQPAWTAEPTAADTARAQLWRQVARQASQVLQAAPQAELIRYLVNRSASDDTFARRHAAFLQVAMGNTRDVFGADMLADLERLTAGASEDRVERMANILMALGDKIAGGESHSQVADLLEKWKSMSPALSLKIFHMQQGLK